MSWRPWLRFFLALLGLFACYRLIVDSARGGISRLFSTVAIVQSGIDSADTAVRLAPTDPEAHYTRALTLVNRGRLAEAVGEFEQTTRLRPHHYYGWLDLGVTLDRLGNQTAAEAALRESVRLAPFYAQPRWQLGNLLYLQGRYEEAFNELRLGVKSNPSLLLGLLDLAWVAADGDAGTMENLVRPQSSRFRLEMARFLERHGNIADSARLAIAAGKTDDLGDVELLNEIILDFLTVRRFSEAYSVWAAHHDRASSGTSALGQFLNGDFVEPVKQNDPGFGWQLAVVPNVSASIDPSGPGSGARSLRLEFGGDSAPGSILIHQLVLLQPNSRYSLSFSARAEDLVSGGPPVVLALSGTSETPKILGQSDPLSAGTGWRTYNVNFSTDESTSAVIFALQRVACNQNPCPIFGKLWLSRFSLVKM